MTKYPIDIRIYYEDTDAGGVVYHANFLKFAERGRTEFLRHLGHQNSQLGAELGVMFVVRHIDIDYHKPAFLDDALKLVTSIKTLKNTSFIMHQSVYRGQELVVDMKVVLVCVDTKTLKPVGLPGKVKSEFERFLE